MTTFKLFASVIVGLMVGGFAVADPPKIEFPTGHLVVTHGSAKVEFLPDGSTRITSPFVTLTLPGKVNPDLPIVPPGPAPDEFASAVASVYGSIVDTGKKDSLIKLIAYYRDAAKLVPSSTTLGDLFGAMRSLPKPGTGEIEPLRDLLRDRMKTVFGTEDPKAKLDQAKTSAMFAQFVAALEACR